MPQSSACIGRNRIRFLAVGLILLVGFGGNSAKAAFAAALQGQSAGSTAWIGGNLQGWRELDYIPCRVYLTGGPATNQTITVEFDHVQSRIPAIQNLSGFTPSANVVIASGPTLSAPTDSERWTYTFKVNLLNAQAGWVEFRARLAAGAHMNVGSSVGLRGTPSLGSLQIHKPAAGVGLPDLVLVKTGAAQAVPGEVISYVLNYSNKTSATHYANGGQITDVLPPQITIVSNSVIGGEIVGNYIFWDLPQLNPGAAGSLSYSVRVSSNTTFGQVFTNSALVLSAEDDANLSDNSSSVATRVSFNRAPIANPDSYNVNEDAVLTISAPGVLANDTDADGQMLSPVFVSGPSHGVLTLNANGSFTYRPNTNYNGTDTFTYKASDGTADSAPATVSIIVNPVNDPPVAANDSYTTDEGAALTIAAPGLLANDSDIDGGPLKAVLVSSPSHGSLTLNLDGSFNYQPATPFTGADSFTYKANDGTADSAPATVTINVRPARHAPIAANDSYTVDEDNQLVISAPGVLANDSDQDNDSLTAILVTGPAHGLLALRADGSFSYLPSTNYNGPDSFTYRASDGALESAPALVTISVRGVNDQPIAAPDNFTVNEDNALTISSASLLSNDSDVDGDGLSVVILSAPSHGTITEQTNGNFRYVPNANFNGTDSFTYAAHDAQTGSAPVAVIITVLPVNDLPAFVKGANVLVPQNATARTISGWATGITAGPPDESGQTLQFIAAIDRPELFSEIPSISPDGTLRFAAAAGAYGVANVTLVLRDNGGTDRGGIDTSAPQSFSISINSPPSVEILSPTNGAVYIAGTDLTIVANASDPDGHVALVQLLSGTNVMRVTMQAPYFHLLTNVAAGTYQFSATATDDLGATAASAPVTITVIEHPPYAAGPFTLNRQTGLFEQVVRVTNPTPNSFGGIRLLIQNVRPQVTVWNATGKTNGIPYVDSKAVIAEGGFVDILVTYYAPDVRVPPDPTFIPELLVPADRRFNEMVCPLLYKCYCENDGGFALEFSAIPNGIYYLQCTDDLISWRTVQPGFLSAGTSVRWTDPNSGAKRHQLYRIVRLP